ncbi:RIIa domain-containing protein 1 [Rhizophlyctis rosea]|nr:RIIa domain-containing protein 1 [Rhizophlyctis rosea]
MATTAQDDRPSIVVNQRDTLQPAPLITPAMQQKLNADKISVRIQNELYLRAHPEIQDILSYFMKQVLTQQPADVGEFAASVISDPELRANVEKHKSDCLEYEWSYSDVGL